jgi:hypothetical protein
MIRYKFRADAQFNPFPTAGIWDGDIDPPHWLSEAEAMALAAEIAFSRADKMYRYPRSGELLSELPSLWGER